MSFWSRWFSRIQPKSHAATGGRPAHASGENGLIEASCVSDEYAWLANHPCSCGGAWKVHKQAKMKAAALPSHFVVDRLECKCARCRAASTWSFAIDTHSEGYKRELRETMRYLGIDPDEPK